MHMTLHFSLLLISWELAPWINWIGQYKPQLQHSSQTEAPENTASVNLTERILFAQFSAFWFWLGLGWETWSVAPGEVSMTFIFAATEEFLIPQTSFEAKGDWENMEVKSVSVCISLYLSVFLSLSLSFPLLSLSFSLSLSPPPSLSSFSSIHPTNPQSFCSFYLSHVHLWASEFSNSKSHLSVQKEMTILRWQSLHDELTQAIAHLGCRDSCDTSVPSSLFESWCFAISPSPNQYAQLSHQGDCNFTHPPLFMLIKHISLQFLRIKKKKKKS